MEVLPGQDGHATGFPSPTSDNLDTARDRALRALLDVRRVAELLGCSASHVYRQADGCPPLRTVKGGGRD